MGRFHCFMLPTGERSGGTQTGLVSACPQVLAPARPEVSGDVPPVNEPPPVARKVYEMRTRRVRGMALVVTATALALAAGCSSGGGAANPPGAEKPDLNVAVVPALDSAGFFVALYGGLFKAQGLNVHFTPATSSETVIADQAKGIYDITGGNYVSYIQAQQQGEANLYIFAEGSVMEPGSQGIYTMPDSKVRDL